MELKIFNEKFGQFFKMKTFLQNLKEKANKLENDFKEYITNYSNIIYDPIDQSVVIIIGRSDYKWENLSKEGKKIKFSLLKDYTSFCELSEIIISKHDSLYKNFINSKTQILRYIKQEERPWVSSTSEIIDSFNNYFKKQIKILDEICFTDSNIPILIPDVNVLLSTDSFETWRFKEFESFEIVLTTTILSELDKLKIYHNNERVKEKAKSIINQIKEYRRRGSLSNGVTIVREKIFLKTLVIEPNFKNTLTWLDPKNNDDRILASFIEVIRDNINRPVFLITNDINLQNKAEFATLPFLESLSD